MRELEELGRIGLLDRQKSEDGRVKSSEWWKVVGPIGYAGVAVGIYFSLAANFPIWRFIYFLFLTLLNVGILIHWHIRSFYAYATLSSTLKFSLIGGCIALFASLIVQVYFVSPLTTYLEIDPKSPNKYSLFITTALNSAPEEVLKFLSLVALVRTDEMNSVITHFQFVVLAGIVGQGFGTIENFYRNIISVSFIDNCFDGAGFLMAFSDSFRGSYIPFHAALHSLATGISVLAQFHKNWSPPAAAVAGLTVSSVFQMC